MSTRSRKLEKPQTLIELLRSRAERQGDRRAYPSLADGWRDPGASAETLAFLQYTSGSTAAPKGVMVSHGNLLHNQELIQNGCGHGERTSFVSWLPLYHDLGLIGNLIQSLYIGAPCTLMSPVSFLQRPVRWLQAISRFGAHTSGGPNFAYDLCVRKIRPEELASLDLGSWQVAFNGAEPVRAETLARFAETFAPCGFRRSGSRARSSTSRRGDGSRAAARRCRWARCSDEQPPGEAPRNEIESARRRRHRATGPADSRWSPSTWRSTSTATAKTRSPCGTTSYSTR